MVSPADLVPTAGYNLRTSSLSIIHDSDSNSQKKVWNKLDKERVPGAAQFEHTELRTRQKGRVPRDGRFVDSNHFTAQAAFTLF
jgi:hypothetical protein